MNRNLIIAPKTKKITREVERGRSRRMLNTLNDLLNFLPPEGTITWENNKINKEQCIIEIPPSAFMSNIDPNSDKVIVEKREFWDKDCTEYIVTHELPGSKIVTHLNRALPRDAKWLDMRR